MLSLSGCRRREIRRAIDGAWGGYCVLRHLNLYHFARLVLILVGSGFEIVQKEPASSGDLVLSLQVVPQEKFGARTRIA
jgi:hypothetical protein